MKERVLITGASGFIGHHLVQKALKEGYDVHAAVRSSSNVSSLQSSVQSTGSLTFVYPDYESKEELKNLLSNEQYTHIIHAAGATRAKNDQVYNHINADYSLSLAQAALEADIPLKRFVFLSSLAAIGPVSYNANTPINEHTKAAPITSYGKSKLLAEQYLSELKSLPLTVIRPTAVFGPREKDILIVFKTLAKGLDPYIGSDPQRLSFVYVDDLVTATIAAMKEESVTHTAYNISDGQEYSRYALSDLFREIKGKHPVRFHLPLVVIKLTAVFLEAFSKFSKHTPVLNQEKIKELTAANWYCSIEAAQSHLKYVPQYNLKKGLAETLSWYSANHWI